MNKAYHIPVLLDESIEGLNIKPNGIYVDVTFGGGGHACEILKHLAPAGKLLAFDQDPDAEKNTPKDPRFQFIHGNFRFLKNFLRYHNTIQVDGIIADLGVSSHHFDTPQRGFSFRFNAQLDMRMNPAAEFSAKNLINSYSQQELIRVFKTYGEIKNAYKLAKIIGKSRENQEIENIEDFIKIIEQLIPKKQENKYLAKIFQALRMEVNREEENLKDFLLQTPQIIAPGGRLVVLSYHSLEDRLVKNFMKTGNFRGEQQKDFYGNIQAPFQPIHRKVIVATEQEIQENNRARSAKLRIAERTEFKKIEKTD